MTWWEKFGVSGVAVALLMIRVASAWPEVKWPEVIGLVLCLCVHYGKHYLGTDQKAGVDIVSAADFAQLQADVTNLESKMSGIELQKGIRSSVSDEG